MARKIEREAPAGTWRPARPKSIRLGNELDEKLTKIAADREMTYSALVRVAVESYLAGDDLRAELANVEERLAVTLIKAIKEVARVDDDVQLVIAFLDQFVKFQMFVEPEVIDKEGSAALGNRRYNAFIDDFKNAFHIRRKRSSFADLVDDED